MNANGELLFHLKPQIPGLQITVKVTDDFLKHITSGNESKAKPLTRQSRRSFRAKTRKQIKGKGKSKKNGRRFSKV